MYLRRFGVVPAAQGHGVAAALIDAAVEAAEGYDDLTVVAREELPATIRFWEHQGFREILRDLAERRAAPAAADPRLPGATTPTRCAASAVASPASAQPGDLIVLTGSLGAGKTTFTQGLGAGLGVRGQVTSPTFVIARVHPSEVGGPALVHVDAYRLGGIDELDDLDLDTSLEQAVTVVEWGEGLAEGLSESRLEINIVRDDEDDDRRSSSRRSARAGTPCPSGGSADGPRSRTSATPTSAARRRPDPRGHVLDHLLAMVPLPDVLVVTGDVADHGTAEEYAEAGPSSTAGTARCWSVLATTTSAPSSCRGLLGRPDSARCCRRSRRRPSGC